MLLQRTALDPKLCVLSVFGKIFSSELAPVTFTPSPTKRLLVTLAPPTVLILPVVKLVAFSVPATISCPLVLILPVTSNASSGLVLLIPTRSVLSILNTVGLLVDVFTLKSILEPEILL